MEDVRSTRSGSVTTEVRTQAAPTYTPGPWTAGTMRMQKAAWAELHSGKHPITIVQRGADVIAAVWDDGDGSAEDANARLIAAAPDLLEALKGLLADVEDLIGESAGVYGLHLNGDPSPWDEIAEGGKFERLTSMSAAHAAITKATESK